MIQNPFSNPEFVRLRRSKLRATTVGLIALSSVALMGGIAGLFVFLRASGFVPMTPSSWGDCFRFQASVMGYGTGYYALVLASQNIVLERDKFTLDFQRMVAMGPWRLAIGKLFGSACEATLALLLMALCSLPVAILSGISIVNWLIIVLVMLVAQYFFIAIGLACSCMAMRVNHAVSMSFFLGTGLLILFSNLAPSMGGFFSMANPYVLVNTYIQENTGGSAVTPCYLFGIKLPMLLAYVLIFVCAIAGFLCVVTRKLMDVEIPLFNVRQACWLFGIAQVFLMGAAVDELLFSRTGNVYRLLPVYTLANAFVLTVLALLLMPSSELLAARVSRSKPGEHWRIFFSKPGEDAPPMMAVAAFGAAYLGLALILTVLGHGAANLNAGHYQVLLIPPVIGLATAAFALALHLYMQNHAFRTTLAFLIAVHLVPIPLCLNFAREKLPVLNVGYWVLLVSSDDKKAPPEQYLLFPALCVILLVLFSLLSAMRIRFLLDLFALERRKSGAVLPSGE